MAQRGLWRDEQKVRRSNGEDLDLERGQQQGRLMDGNA